MSARNYSQTLSAGQVIKLPAGRYFYVRTASGVLDIATEGATGAPVEFLGVGAGSKFGPVPESDRWTLLRVYSASAQAIEIIISDDGLFDVASAVTVNGSVTTAEAPSVALASPAAVVVGTGTASSIAANLARRRISISALDTNTGNLFVQAAGAGAGRGVLLPAGVTMEFKTTAALDVRNDTGANATYSTLEET